MLCHLALVRTDMSERSASIIRVTRIVELGTSLAINSNQCTLQRNPIIPEDGILHSHRHENLKSNCIVNLPLILMWKMQFVQYVSS
jgi:hypothetical protein